MMQEIPVHRSTPTPMRPTLRRWTHGAALALALLAAAPAAAQIGNQSDISGPYVNGSGAAAGSFLGAGIRTENEMFARAGERTVFRNARVGCAARTAAEAYQDSVARLPRDPASALVDAVVASSARRDAVEELARRLSRGLTGQPAQEARTLAESLAGLLDVPDACAGDREEYGEAPQWERVIRTFNDLVEDAPDSYFGPPPPELIAVHDMLFDVVSRALGRRRAP